MRRPSKKNQGFKDSALVNDATFYDYLERLKKIALSMYEWVNLPETMNSRWLEMCLYYKGSAGILYDENYGFINTNATSAGEVNIYGLPTRINCYSYQYQSTRKLYSGLNQTSRPENECIFVMNNWDRVPTASTIELFALRLYEAERACDVNIKNQKFPLFIATDENQRLTFENMYSQVDGNRPVVFGDKNSGISYDSVKVLKTDAPFVADKLMEYKKQIWNEALQFLGIANLDVEKKERLITSESSKSNEVTNLNLMSYLAPRKQACKEFNEKYGFTGTDKEIDVRVRSDLWNIIKEQESIINDYDLTDGIVDLGEGVNNG